MKASELKPLDILTTQDVADIMKFTPETIQARVRSGKLEPITRDKPYRFWGQTVMDYLRIQELLKRLDVVPTVAEKRKSNAAAAREAVALGRR
jgi:hypothetical protein